MANDQGEAGLIEALFDGISETPLWATFLDRLRHATAADHVTLSFHAHGRDPGKTTYVRSSRDGTSQVEQADPQHFYPLDRLDTKSRGNLIEGKPYSLKDLFGSGAGPREEFYLNLVDREGIGAIRQMRVQEKSGIDAWLTIARGGADFTAKDTGLLSALAPVLRGVLQLYVATEQEKFAAALHAKTARRLNFGWIVLDRDGRVLECDEHGQLVLSASGILSRRPNGRLTARSAVLERQIFETLECISKNALVRPRAIILSRDPWLDMLIVPARGKSISTDAQHAAIAYVHGDSLSSTDCREHLSELFGLSPREARLALAVSRGMTLAEAAAEFGLTIGTTRAYSKSIYAKTGARGLPDLVRIVMRSVLAISPEA